MVLFGTIVEGALQEMEKRGPDNAPRWERKYRLSDLLTPGFVLRSADSGGDFDALPGRGTTDRGLLIDEV